MVIECDAYGGVEGVYLCANTSFVKCHQRWCRSAEFSSDVSCLHRGRVDSPVRGRDRQLLCGEGLTERSFLRVQGGLCHKDGSRTVQ